MMFWAATSLILAFACALLGFGGQAPSADISKALAVIFLALFVAALFVHGDGPGRPRR